MYPTVRSIVALSFGCVSLSVTAQPQAGEEPESFIYATYYACDLNRQEEADRIIEQDIAPIYDEAVDSGAITGWGWLSHHTGGPWRRLFYMTANSVGALLTAQASLAEQEDPRANERFDAACGTHDDYIWQSLATGGQADSRGSLSLSTYYNCDISREDRANEIFETTLAPLLDAQVENGLIRAWGWNEHVVGGGYRRLGTVTGDDWARIFEAIDAYVDAAAASELGREMWEICDSHADYLWNIELER